MVEDPEQLEALTLPARLELIDTVAAVGPCSVAEMAEHLGRKRAALYHHVARLEEVGLLRAVDTRATSRRDETLYDAPGRDIVLVRDPEDPDRIELHVRATSANLRLTARDVATALRAGRSTRGRRRELHVGRIKGWLTREQLARANDLIEELEGLVNRGRPVAGARLYTVTAALAPHPESGP